MEQNIKNDLNISEVEMIEALKRSGYLLESEISKVLAEAGFSIETNQIIEDPITGKGREIDLMAEFNSLYNEERSRLKVASKVRFIFEIKNNLFPIVLLTKYRFTPNIEDWIGLKEAVTLPNDIKYEWFESFYDELIKNRSEGIYTQYCSFHKKKANDELMALHPDNIHDGLLNITLHCEEMVKIFDTSLLYEKTDTAKKDDYFRHFIYLPILLLNDNLYELIDDKLTKVDSSILIFNYFFNKEPKMAYIFVLTKKGFPAFMNKMINLENRTEQKMYEARKEIEG